MSRLLIVIVVFISLALPSHFSFAYIEGAKKKAPTHGNEKYSRPSGPIAWLKREVMYKDLPVISHGSYGVAFFLNDHVVKVSLMADDPSTASNILDAAILNSIDHPALQSPVSTMIVYGKYGTYLEIHQPFYEKALRKPAQLLGDVASMLKFMHELGIAHRDIKPDHLFKNGNRVTVIDWGAADIFTSQPVTWCGTTLSYCSAEVLCGKHMFPHASDMWSLGVTVVDYCSKSGKRIVLGRTKCEVVNCIRGLTKELGARSEHDEDVEHLHNSAIGKVIRSFDPENNVAPYLMGLWNLDYEERMTAAEVAKDFPAYDVPAYLAPLSKEGLTDSVNLRMRAKMYAWFAYIGSYLELEEKIIFETMSIADAFFLSSLRARNDMYLTTFAAFYLTLGLYHDGIDIDTLQKFAKTNFEKTAVLEHLFELLSKAKFHIIYNHSLRAHQQTIFQELSGRERSMAISLLKLLEIDRTTFVLSNEEKWEYVRALLYDERTEENKMKLEAIRALYIDLTHEIYNFDKGLQLMKIRVERALREDD